MGDKVAGGPPMGESGAKRLDDPLKGMQTFVHTFLESSRMFSLNSFQFDPIYNKICS